MLDVEFDEDNFEAFYVERIQAGHSLGAGEQPPPEQLVNIPSFRKFKPGDREAYLKECYNKPANAAYRATIATREQRRRENEEQIRRLHELMLTQAREKRDWSLTPQGKIHAEYWLKRGKCPGCYRRIFAKADCTEIWCPLAPSKEDEDGKI